MIIAASAVSLVAFATTVLVMRRDAAVHPADAVADLPVPRETPPARVERASLVGSAPCARCHATQFAQWERSTHGRAGGTTARSLVAPFDGTPIRFRDATVIPRRARGGAGAEFVVTRDDGSTTTVAVDGIIGGAHLAGGGTQGFVTHWRDGTYRVLPFDYSGTARSWFCNTGSRTGAGWVPITSALPLEACGDWTPVRVLGDAARFANCQSCHASAATASLDTTRGMWETRFATLAIDCESCHGPARVHVQLAEAGALATSPTAGLARLATLDQDASLAVCYRCHSVKDQLRPEYLPGTAVETHYSLALPLLGDRPLTADGRVRTFAYQEGHRYSGCYLQGGMRCTDCHDPHTQNYRDVNGNPLNGRDDDRQCTSCHPSKAEATAMVAHTHHPAASRGSRCVACHMPYRQEPEIGDAVPYARSDHSIAIPRPRADSALGLRTACALCHADRATATLEADVGRWYGALAPRNPAVDAQLRAESATGDAASRLLLAPDTARATDALTDPAAEQRAGATRAVDGAARSGRHALARAAGIARFIDRVLAGETDLLAPTSRVRLSTLARDDADVDVRALALAALGLGMVIEADGDARATARDAAAQALARAGAHDRALRDRWALALGYAGDRLATLGRGEQAVRVYRLALTVRPDDPAILEALGNAQRELGALAAAASSYRRSLAARGDRPLVLVNLGIAAVQAGDTATAVASWQRALRLDAHEPLAAFNLANVALMRGALDTAVALYRETLASDGSMTAAWMNLARAHASVGQFAAADAAARQAARFGDAGAGALIAQIATARRAVRR